MKRITFLSALLFLYLGSNAQIKLGLKFSPHVTWVTEDNKTTKSNGARINVAYGLMADYYFTENYAFGTELTVTTFGANLSVPASKVTAIEHNGKTHANTKDVSYDYKLQYIQIPAMLKMRTKEIGYLRYYAEFGFSMGILFRSKADVSFANVNIDNININDPDAQDEFKMLPTNYSDEVNTFRASMIFGAGVQYNFFGNSLLVGGIRYDNGLNSFTDDDSWNSSLQYISLTAGVLF